MVTRTVTIASGASLSDAVDIEGAAIVGIQMPASWTAAALTFQGSSDDLTFGNISNDAGAEKSITVSASAFVSIPVSSFLGGCSSVKVRSGTAATPVNQAGDRSIILTLFPI